MNIRAAATFLVSTLTLMGCVPGNIRQEVDDGLAPMQKGPSAPVKRNITNFSDGLRCMDNLLITYGVRDVTVMLEDLADNTKKVSAGTRDMLISAVSDMTRRSRAIRLIAFGSDAGNLAAFMANAERKGAFASIPTYDIRGSISQMDENMLRKQADAGIELAGVGLGRSKSAGATLLALDLSMITTADFALLPGVTAKNSVLIYKEGDATDAEATIKKFGVNFSTSVNKSEGTSQGLRNMVELATIELFGRLLKLPYWSCLGVDAASTAVKSEMSDWYYAMNANGEITSYLQQQMRNRKFYEGAVDGNANPQLQAAIAQYKAALGMAADDNVDLPFFVAFLNQPVPSKAEAANGSIRPGAVRIASVSHAKRFKRGEPVNLTIKSSADAYLYCFYQNGATKKVMRFFPNRFAKDPRIAAGAEIAIPGEMRFRLTANSTGATELISCFAAGRDLYNELPAPLRAGDFEVLNVPSTEQVRQAFLAAASGELAEAHFNIEAR